MSANGHLADSELAPIPGGRLRKDAAARWNAMQALVHARTGISLEPNGSLSSYRNFAGQVAMRRYWCGQGRCQNAAIPGTSNHGLGLAVDVNRPDLVNRFGAPYGFQKRWSDAPWENWHMRWAGFGLAVDTSRPVLHAGMSGKAVARLQRLLRAHGFRSLPSQGHSGYGYYGQRTRSAARRFQRAHHLPPDGVIGPRTWAALTNRRG